MIDAKAEKIEAKKEKIRQSHRMRDLPGRTGMSRTMIYNEIKDGNFPPGRLIAPTIRIWTEDEIAAEMERRFELYNDKQSA